MGQKVNPAHGFRLRITTDWKGAAGSPIVRSTPDNVVEDWKIRDYLLNELPRAAISRVVKRTRERLRVDVHASVGRRDRSCAVLRPTASVDLTRISGSEGQLNIGIKRPEPTLRALIAQETSPTSLPVVAFHVAMKRAVQNAQRESGPSVSSPVVGPPRQFRRWPAPSICRAVCAAHPACCYVNTASAGPDHHSRIGVKVWLYKSDIPSLQNRPRARPTFRGGDGCRRDVGPEHQAPQGHCQRRSQAQLATPETEGADNEGRRKAGSAHRKPIPNSSDCSTRRTPSRPPLVSSRTRTFR